MRKEQSKIQKILLGIDRPTLMKERQALLKQLVENYGYDLVSSASGWSVSTIIQYCQSSNPEIGLSKLTQAESILKQL